MLRSLSTDTITHTTNQTDKETTSKPTLLYYNKPNLHRIQIENEYYTTYETHSKSMNVKQSE